MRVSGPEAVSIAGSFCPGGELDNQDGFRAVPARFVLPDSGILSCEVYIFRAPASYTTEDVAEIHFPGSPLLAEKILLALAHKGARPALPGEFTRRAFLGGRIDLVQAEAVGAVIEARSSAELAAAGNMLAGGLSEKLRSVSGQLKDLLALVEASLDFSSHEIEIASAGEISSQISGTLELLEPLAGWEMQPGRDVLKVIICGATNVGKSSLFNRMLAKERALTSPVPGTTRDVVSAPLDLDGTKIQLLDSAGRKESAGRIEKLVLSALDRHLEGADFALFVVEAHKQSSRQELDFFNQIECRKLLIANKCDLGESGDMYLLRDPGFQAPGFPISCLTGQGIDKLKVTLKQVISAEVDRSPDALALSVRQRDAIRRAAVALRRGQTAAGEELLAQDLREALGALGEITGETLPEDILDRIFSRFCIGK